MATANQSGSGSPAGVPGTERQGNSDLLSLVRPNTALYAYLFDAFQRSVIFLDILRQRGNAEQAISSRPMATVLRYDYEIVMHGPTLPRPINYYLARITPPSGIHVDPNKAPIIVIDPRAGQGPGIGGFKTQSEIGDALSEGHPVYFVGFSSDPVAEQTFLDVVDGQVAFVRARRSAAPAKPSSSRFRQLPSRLPNPDGGNVASGFIQHRNHGWLANVILARCTWREPSTI